MQSRQQQIMTCGCHIKKWHRVPEDWGHDAVNEGSSITKQNEVPEECLVSRRQIPSVLRGIHSSPVDELIAEVWASQHQVVEVGAWILLPVHVGW